MNRRRIDVVGAVIEGDDGTVLCAERGGTGPLAGLWEFPGGKIEPGESAREALVREIAEELRCGVSVGDEVTTTTHSYDFGTVTLITFWCTLVSGWPTLTEHASVRWLRPTELHALTWAPADLPAVDLILATRAR